MSRYAEKTDVSSDRSRSEIEKTLARYGANKFMYGWEDGRAIVCFEMNSKRVRFELPLPDRNDREITHTPGRDLERTPPQQAKEYEQRVKQKWRALCLVIKAKLEATETGITTFEEEFLARAETHDIGGINVPVACAEDVLIMKVLGGRPKDLEDVEAILARRKGLDLKRVRATLRLLESALDRSDLISELDRVSRRAKR